MANNLVNSRRYSSLYNNEESTLDKFIDIQAKKAKELGVTQFSVEMNIAFTKILNTCVDYSERGLYYDCSEKLTKVLSLSNKQKNSPKR